MHLYLNLPTDIERVQVWSLFKNQVLLVSHLIFSPCMYQIMLSF